MALTNPMDVNVLDGGTGSHARNVADQFVPEIWGPAILDAFDKKSVFMSLCNDHSSMLASGGDLIHLPMIGNVAVQDRPAIGTALAADQSGSDTSQSLDLTVNEHNVAQLWIPEITKIQASYDLVNMYAGRLGQAMATAVDNHIVSTILADSGFATTSGPDATTTLALGNSGEISGKLDDIHKLCLQESGSTEGWALVLGPTSYASLTAIAETAGFVYGTASPLGSGYASTGVAGTVLGMPVIMSNNVYFDVDTLSADATVNAAEWTGFDSDDGTTEREFRGLLVHRDALHIAFSKKAALNVTYEHLYLSHLMTSDAVYGVKVRTADANNERRIFALVNGN